MTEHWGGEANSILARKHPNDEVCPMCRPPWNFKEHHELRITASAEWLVFYCPCSWMWAEPQYRVGADTKLEAQTAYREHLT